MIAYTTYALVFMIKLNKARRSMDDAFKNRRSVDKIGEISGTLSRCMRCVRTTFLYICYFIAISPMLFFAIYDDGNTAHHDMELLTEAIVELIWAFVFLILFIRFLSASKRIKLISNRVTEWKIMFILLYVGLMFTPIFFTIAYLLPHYSFLYQEISLILYMVVPKLVYYFVFYNHHKDFSKILRKMNTRESKDI